MLAKKPLLAVCLALLTIILGSFALVRDRECCEEMDPDAQALMASAERGDVAAIRALYKRAASDGVEPMAEHWALMGALAGDREMRMSYVQMFRTNMDSTRQQKVLASIGEKSDMPGVHCLLVELNRGSTSVSPQCI